MRDKPDHERPNVTRIRACAPLLQPPAGAVVVELCNYIKHLESVIEVTKNERERGVREHLGQDDAGPLPEEGDEEAPGVSASLTAARERIEALESALREALAIDDEQEQGQGVETARIRKWRRGSRLALLTPTPKDETP